MEACGPRLLQLLPSLALDIVEEHGILLMTEDQSALTLWPLEKGNVSVTFWKLFMRISTSIVAICDFQVPVFLGISNLNGDFLTFGPCSAQVFMFHDMC